MPFHIDTEQSSTVSSQDTAGLLLREALEDAGYEPRAYSGRAMFGKQCVSVVLDSEGDIWNVARNLDANTNVPAPRTDSMGRGIVIYWPSAIWRD